MTDHDPDRWEIDQDEFGRPVVRHRHPGRGVVPAYVAKDWRSDTVARCPECGEQFRINTSDSRP